MINMVSDIIVEVYNMHEKIKSANDVKYKKELEGNSRNIFLK